MGAITTNSCFPSDLMCPGGLSGAPLASRAGQQAQGLVCRAGLWVATG